MQFPQRFDPLIDQRAASSMAWRLHRAVVMKVSNFRELRAWKLAYAIKLGIYRLIQQGPISADFSLRDQLRNAAASAPSNISEGFGRFDPGDFARLVKIAKASVIECQNHLQDAVDRGYISEGVSREHTRTANDVLTAISGLLDYLQSPEAKQNAERIRNARIRRRRERRNTQRPPET